MNLVIISALFFVLPVYELAYSAIADLGGIRNRGVLLVPIYTDGNAMLKTSKRLEWNRFFVIIFPNLQFPKIAL